MIPLSKEMQRIIKIIEKKGFYRVTALDTERARWAIRRMRKAGMLEVIAQTDSYIDFGRLWV